MARPAPIITGLKCRCPRCGEGKLFTGYLKLAPACSSCGLDLKFADSGDGPAIFVIFLVAPIVMVLALAVGALFNPPPYVHLMLWIPVTILLSLALLPPFKGVLIALQYRHDAHEGHQ
ncbi:MAG: DUF983 domain-containing protein [Alphaproteobacteria bacterium]|jgi:uncharacterized protein (DUF983 family)|uniref:DUF983 domain-containing protein n=1 Tax=Devosia sp. XGJD_8 TaxID=3391187 RepID=UPI001DA8960F|nr:DUF983 domain-containing protein [Alphaproteobacteria bacterium]MBU1562737.1 DUF983 domain-containing protein [Alphaproteobacteria bacterium]MBU2303493.1 DUF983 domain-containing protein [Alphaproteobacteria bacterium]MBU2367018.1 DUF983 domain-containing protein [Alphaproteobacteria bacterium]